MKHAPEYAITRRRTLGMLGALSLSPKAFAADPAYPAKPIRLILPFSAGSSTDFTSRLVAEQLTRLPQSLRAALLRTAEPPPALLSRLKAIERRFDDKAQRTRLVSRGSLSLRIRLPKVWF